MNERQKLAQVVLNSFLAIFMFLAFLLTMASATTTL